MGIDKETLSRMDNSDSYEEVMVIISEFTRKKNLENKEIIKLRLQEYPQEWNQIKQVFTQFIEEITELQWTYPTYTILLSCIHTGIILGWDQNKIVISTLDDGKTRLRLIAHELLMTHMWQYFNRNYEKQQETDKNMHFWALMEISAVFLLGLEQPIKNLWIKRLQGAGEKFLQTYPNILCLYRDLMPIYKGKRNFSEYANMAVDLVTKKYKNTNFGIQGK